MWENKNYIILWIIQKLDDESLIKYFETNEKWGKFQEIHDSRDTKTQLVFEK